VVALAADVALLDRPLATCRHGPLSLGSPVLESLPGLSYSHPLQRLSTGRANLAGTYFDFDWDVSFDFVLVPTPVISMLV